MSPELNREARQMLVYLQLTSAQDKLGATRCSAESLMITMSLHSITPAEAAERLRNQLDGLREALR